MSAKDRSRTGKTLKRTTGTVPVKATFRVYTEGVQTEPDYIDALRRLPEFADSVAMQIVIEEAGATPMRLVESARNDKRRRDLDIDHYWCIFDVEHPVRHPHLDRARQMARDNEIRLAISNPCFELWPILHHRLQQAHLSTDDAIRLRKDLDGSDGKQVDGPRYMASLTKALRHAAVLRRRHERDGTAFPEDNPSSSVDLFVAHLRASVSPT